MASNDIEIRLSVSGGQQAQKSIEKVEKASVDLKEGAKGIGETFSSVGEAVEKSGGLMGAGFAAVGESVLGVSEAVGGMKDALATAGEVGGKAWLNMLGPAALLISAVGAAIEAFREFSGAAREAEMWEEAMSATASDLTSRMEALAEEGIKPSTAELKGFIEANQQARLTLELLGLKNETLVKKYQERKKWSDLVSKAEKQQAEEAKKANVETGLLSKAGGVVADVFTDVASVFVSVEKSTVDLKIAKESLAKANEAVAKGERELALVYEKEVIPQLQAALKAQTVASNTQEKLDDQLYERLKELEDLNIQKLELQKKDKEAIDLIGSSTKTLTTLQIQRKQKESELNDQLKKGVITQEAFQEKIFALKGETYELIKAEEARIEVEKRSLRGLQDRADKEEKVKQRADEARQKAEEAFNFRQEMLNKELELEKKRLELSKQVGTHEQALEALRRQRVRDAAARGAFVVQDVTRQLRQSQELAQSLKLEGFQAPVKKEVQFYSEVFEKIKGTTENLEKSKKEIQNILFSTEEVKVKMMEVELRIREITKNADYTLKIGTPVGLEDLEAKLLSELDKLSSSKDRKMKQDIRERLKAFRQETALNLQESRIALASQAEEQIKLREAQLREEENLNEQLFMIRKDWKDPAGTFFASFRALEAERLKQSVEFFESSEEQKREILLRELSFEEEVLQRRAALEEDARKKSIEALDQAGLRELSIYTKNNEDLLKQDTLLQERLNDNRRKLTALEGRDPTDLRIIKRKNELLRESLMVGEVQRALRSKMDEGTKRLIAQSEDLQNKQAQVESEYLLKSRANILSLQNLVKQKDQIELDGMVEKLNKSEELFSVSRMLFASDREVLKEAVAIITQQDLLMGRNVEGMTEQLKIIDEALAKSETIRTNIKTAIFALSPTSASFEQDVNTLQKKLDVENEIYEDTLKHREQLIRNSNTAIAEINAKFREQEREDAAAGWKAIGDMLKETYIAQVQAISSGLGQIFYDESTDQKLKELESNRQAAMDQYKGDMKARADIEKQYLQQKRQIQAEDANMVSNLLKQTLRAAAQEALVKSIYHTGLGFGALAMGPLGGMSAAGHFKAAAIFAGLATLSGIASKAAGSGAAGAGASTSLSPTGASQTTSAPVREEAKNTEPIVFNINLAGATVYDTRQAAEQAMANRIMSLANRSVRGASNPFTR